MAVIPNRSASGANANDVVIAWDLNFANQNLSTATGWPQRYTVGNPEAPASFVNFRVVIPLGPVENGNAVFYGDLFCAGHCWLPDGRLFVAGGNAQYNPFFLGSRYVGIWDPLWAHSAANNYGWTHLAGGSEGIPMRLARWYPTCTLISNRYVMVSGGVTRTGTLGGSYNKETDPAWDTYELFDCAPTVMDWVRDPAAGDLPKLFDGPRGAAPTNGGNMRMRLGECPYMHLLSNNSVICCGGYRWSSRVDPDPLLAASNGDVTLPPAVNDWSVLLPTDSGFFRNHGSSVMVPNVGNILALRDQVMVIGGERKDTVTNTNEVHADSRLLLPFASQPAWGSSQNLGTPRMVTNAVLVPNGDITLIGGSSGPYFPGGANGIPVYHASYWDRANGWQNDPDGIESIGMRMYHSTAVLLPSGRIASAGSDMRTVIGYGPGGQPNDPRYADWEVYVPRNLANGQVQPQFTGAWAGPGYRTMAFGGIQIINFVAQDEDPVSRVVLMRPCSTTHGVDMDQRYIELSANFFPNNYDLVEVKSPANPSFTSTAQGSIEALPGYYMLFLVTVSGATSPAKWVWLQ